MTTTERPEKRALLVHCDHPSTELCEHRWAAVAHVLTEYPPSTPAPPLQPGREVVVLAEIRAPRARVTPQRPPLIIENDDERHGDSLLGAAGAWACVAISVLLIVAIAVRHLWLWWLG